MPLEGKSGAGGVVAGDGARLGVDGVVVADDQAVYWERVLSGDHILGEGGYALFYGSFRGAFQELALHGGEPLLVEPCHALAPTVDVGIRIY